MTKIVLRIMTTTCLFPCIAFAQEPNLKAVMQINSQNLPIVLRGLRNALDISDTAKAEGRHLDLKLVVFGPAVDLFVKGIDPELLRDFKKLSETGNVHFLVDDRRLKKIGKEVTSLLPGFKDVKSGAYEVLKLEAEGYLYIKP
jgi:intracellular sulfur oxidation DsrE/DsrF family protein